MRTTKGEKLWISNSEQADLFFVFANAIPSQGYKGITCFVVDKNGKQLTSGCFPAVTLDLGVGTPLGRRWVPVSYWNIAKTICHARLPVTDAIRANLFKNCSMDDVG